MFRRPTASLSLFVALVSAVVLAACGGGGGAESPVEILTRAGDRTVDAGSARMTLDLTFPGQAGDVAITGDGITDFQDQTSQVTVDMGPFFASFGVPAGDGTMEALTFGTQVYIRAPILQELLGLGTPWLGMDLDRLADEQFGADLEQLSSFSNNDPRQTLAILEGSTEGAIDEVGEEEVRGVTTTHYRATVDLRKAYEESGAIVDPERFDAFLDQLGTESLEIDAWIDEDGLPRRIAYEMPFPGSSSGAQVSMDLYDFGVDVELTAPAAEEVTDLLDLAGR